MYGWKAVGVGVDEAVPGKAETEGGRLRREGGDRVLADHDDHIGDDHISDDHISADHISDDLCGPRRY